MRVSLDHYTAGRHEEERGRRHFGADASTGLRLAGAATASRSPSPGRTMWGEDRGSERAGYAPAVRRNTASPIDAADPAGWCCSRRWTSSVDVPEITTACWGILGKSPADVMCALAHGGEAQGRGAAGRAGVHAAAVRCRSSRWARRWRRPARAVPLNHPHCAKFCVLGGAKLRAAVQGRTHDGVEFQRPPRSFGGLFGVRPAGSDPVLPTHPSNLARM